MGSVPGSQKCAEVGTDADGRKESGVSRMRIDEDPSEGETGSRGHKRIGGALKVRLRLGPGCWNKEWLGWRLRNLKPLGGGFEGGRRMTRCLAGAATWLNEIRSLDESRQANR